MKNYNYWLAGSEIPVGCYYVSLKNLQIMLKTDMFKRKDGALLAIYLCSNEDLIGIVYMDGNEKRGHHDFKARFDKKQNEATIYRVKEYFHFNNENSIHWWKRWA